MGLHSAWTNPRRELLYEGVRAGEYEQTAGRHEALKAVDERERRVQSVDEVGGEHAVELAETRRQLTRVAVLEQHPLTVLHTCTQSCYI